MSDSTDPKILIELPLSTWNFLVEQLGKSPFNDVANLIMEISNQATPQIIMAAATSNPSPAVDPVPPNERLN